MAIQVAQPPPPQAQSADLAQANNAAVASGNAAFKDFDLNAGEVKKKTSEIEEEVKKNIGEQSQTDFKMAQLTWRPVDIKQLDEVGQEARIVKFIPYETLR